LISGGSPLTGSSRVPRAARWLAALVLSALLPAGGYYARRRFFSPAPSTALLSDLSLVRRADGVYVSDVSRLPRVEVLSVVDGDTLHVRWDGRDERLRYYGVNTPERDQACYDEATARNAALAGRAVLLAFDERPRDKYGRILAYAFTPDGKSIEGDLVSGGWGRAWTRDGRWRDMMDALQKESRDAGAGCLWSRPEASATRRARGKAPRRARRRAAP
jgi:endonuclease YncB( thermonuclease family)